MRPSSLKSKLLGMAAIACLPVLGGCETFHTVSYPGEAPMMVGSPVRDNTTPTEGPLSCLAWKMHDAHSPVYGIGVGDVKDYTAKYSQYEGATVTQGGSLMVYSALGKLGPVVRIHERFDTRIGEAELTYADRRQLGDGHPHVLQTAKGAEQVPWLPYFGGSIEKSDYYIVGGITEVNYNIQSGGFDGAVNLIGPSARVFTLNVAVDLRIVDSRSLVVLKTVSLEKQLTGYEVDGNIFSFFGKAQNLWDVDVGAKNQEPMQFGIRMALEEGVLKLVGSVANVDYQSCLTPEGVKATAEEARHEGVPPLPAPTPAALPLVNQNPAPAPPLPPPPAPAPNDVAVPVPERPQGPPLSTAAAPPPQSGPIQLQDADPGQGADTTSIQVPFEIGSNTIGGDAEAAIDKIATTVSTGGVVRVTLVARETETWDPNTRSDVIAKRIAAVTSALEAKGVAATLIMVTWTATQDQMTHDGPGFQEIAKLKVG
jgi:curli biogenesis system outer membrane secretion channel CsgG